MSWNYRVKVSGGPVREIFVETLLEAEEEITELKREYPSVETAVYTRRGSRISGPWYL